MNYSPRTAGENTVIQEERSIPVIGDYQVAVAGGGVAGIAAALAAARSGAKTVLIERNGFLGGTATAAAMAVLSAPYDYAHGIYRELCDRLITAGGGYPSKVAVMFDPEIFKFETLKMLDEAGVTIMPYTFVNDALVESGNRVRGLVVNVKQGCAAVRSEVTVDCTGDGDIAFYSGAEYQKGRESDGLMRPLTLIFRIGNVNFQALAEHLRRHPEEFSSQPDKNLLDLEHNLIRLFGFFKPLAEARAKGEISGDLHYIRFEGGNIKSGTVFINTTRVYRKDGLDPGDLIRSELEARQQMNELLHFFRKYVPGCEDCVLIDSAPALGVRETRRIRGEVIFDESDVVAKTLFPDRITVNYQYGLVGAPMHSPDGGEGSLADSRERGEVKAFLHGYSLPYRALLPRRIDSLLVAGRCLSTTHDGDHWTRPMPVCITTGQAAGVAAALSALSGIEPRQLDIAKLQQALKNQNVNLEFR